MTESSLDRIFIRDLLVRGIVGINPDERTNRQDVLVNVTLWANTRLAGASDDIADAVNYNTAYKAIMPYSDQYETFLVERLAADLVKVCFESDNRIEAVELTVEKPGALRFARSVGLTIYRKRGEIA